MPARPLTPAQRGQHAAFLRELARTGNAQAAARAIGVSDRTLHARRKVHPAFAQAWDATLAAAHARLHRAGGARSAPGRGEGGGAGDRAAADQTTISLCRNGRLQLRRARRDAVTRAGEQRFLLALSATANISLSAAAAGASAAAFNKRRRANPAFAREVRAALAQGYERLESALLESWLPGSGEDAAWRANEPPALPPMTPAQALQLLHLHHREVHWRETVLSRRLLPGETGDLRSARMRRLYGARLAADAEETLAREAARIAARLERLAPPPIMLPDLSQVQGWSQADPARTAANAGRPHGGAMREALTQEAQARGLQNARAARRGVGRKR
ncbi:hypothetical protein [uncultured Sphingomonas sp.]|uniref:hypothetical protein n=1 Tax=uncultured Sphingomonas sp. TaxID=158754 RepID=UPI0035CAC27E